MNQANSVWEYIQLYLRWGLSLIPVGENKRPRVATSKPYQERRPSEEELRRWFIDEDHWPAAVMGKVSGNCFRLDFDTEDHYWRLKETGLIPEDAPTFKTPRPGMGVLLRSMDTPPNLKEGSIEGYNLAIKGEGSYTVLPPTPGGEPTNRRLETFTGSEASIDSSPGDNHEGASHV